jgi:hypothetical protein
MPISLQKIFPTLFCGHWKQRLFPMDTSPIGSSELPSRCHRAERPHRMILPGFCLARVAIIEATVAYGNDKRNSD